jgi:putative transcriptional regulator
MDIMKISEQSPATIAKDLGNRLKLARLNCNLTQSELAQAMGVTRKTILNAEKGKASLEIFVAILQAMDLLNQLDQFLAKPNTSPIQLVKLQGKQRQRATGQKKNRQNETPQW